MKKKVKIKDIALYSKGTQINGDELLEEAKFDYLNGGIKPSGKWDNANCVANTVTISEGGNSCGYVNFMKNPFWCGAHCYFLYDTKIDSKYLYYALKSQQVWIMKLRSGACMPNIKKTDLGNFEFVCDDNSIEQKKITHILDKLECVIEQRKNEIQVFDELVKARFIEVFGDPVTNSMRWYETTVGDECFYIKDGPHKSLTDIGKENGGHPFISVRNIVNGYIDLSTARYISDDDYAEAIKKCHPEKGDILYSKGGTTGIAKLVDIDEKFANWVHVAVLKFDKTKLNGVFLENMLNGAYCYEQSQRLTKGIANRDLVLSAIAKIKLYRPPIYLQEKFADFVRQADKSKAVIEKSLKELETLQASLMQKYFS